MVNAILPLSGEANHASLEGNINLPLLVDFTADIRNQ